VFANEGTSAYMFGLLCEAVDGLNGD
jgi:hypothetical protein